MGLVLWFFFLWVGDGGVVLRFGYFIFVFLLVGFCVVFCGRVGCVRPVDWVLLWGFFSVLLGLFL